MGTATSKQQDEVNLWHFELMRVVGKGAFGKVRIAQKKDTKRLYALKYIDKMQCIRQQAIQNIFRERAILENLCHPFIVNLKYAFQDDQSLFFVLDLKTGGDLRHHLTQRCGFPEAAVKLWALELASAIQFLHTHNIVHRDIKPDNVLLDENGHAHLTDFNIAVNIDRSSVLKSRSGTMAYLAPEVLGENGYYWQVDWWGLGVMLYELIYYKRPFRGKTSQTMIASITNGELNFPRMNMFSRSRPVDISPDCISFLEGLLDRNPLTRLGCARRQVMDVRSHPWVASIDWRAVELKQVPSVFVPNADEDNFDPRVNLEEFLLDGFPVETAPKHRKNKSGKRGTTSPTAVNTNPTLGKKGNSASSNPNVGSFMANYISGNSSTNSKRRASAADVAAIAGNVEQMMKHYKSNNAGFNLFGSAKMKQQTRQLTEGERIELELRFMADHFLPYDSSKNPTLICKMEEGDLAPPVPPMPSADKLKQYAVPVVPPVNIVDESLLSANRIMLDGTTKNALIPISNPDMEDAPVSPRQWKAPLLGLPNSSDALDSILPPTSSTFGAPATSDSTTSSFASSTESSDKLALSSNFSDLDSRFRGFAAEGSSALVSLEMGSRVSLEIPDGVGGVMRSTSLLAAHEGVGLKVLTAVGGGLRSKSRDTSAASVGNAATGGGIRKMFRVTTVKMPDDDLDEGRVGEFDAAAVSAEPIARR
ncbi:kinase-like domain-containing protein [Chytriomyces sp. MP71]|nr:kinase-like domain-containing protein [Chytriomyces sp. MP71]